MSRAYDTGAMIGKQLVGSSAGLSDTIISNGFLDDSIMDDMDFCAGLDAHAMLCEGCGWWFNPEEEGKDGTCEDCLGGEDGEAIE